MPALTASEILILWDRGAGCHPLDRSVLLAAAARPDLDHAFAREQAQRLADRRARDAEAPCQLDFIEVGARRQLAGRNLFLDRFAQGFGETAHVPSVATNVSRGPHWLCDW